MSIDPGTDPVRALELAIAALEQQRGVLGDAVVDTALAPLTERRDRLRRRQVERRKLVTVLISDLVDSTPLTAALGAETMREVMARYFDRWRAAIEHEGGSVQKYIGDAVVGVFGMARSREDDPHRAVRAALRVRDELPALSAQVHRDHGVELHMRVGIDTGEVVLGALTQRAGDDLVVVGESLNLASRLQSAAPVDSVLLSAATARHVRGSFGLQRVADLALKGIDGVVSAYAVRGPVELDFWGSSRGIEGVRTHTVGREAELARLRAAFTDVAGGGRCTVVTVVGDAGIGKSRLLAEFEGWLAALPEQVWLLRGRADPADQTVPHALLRSAFAERLGILATDAPEVVRAKWRAGLELLALHGEERGDRAGPLSGEDADAIATWLGYPVGDLLHLEAWRRDPQALQRRALRALDDLVARMAEEAPVVLLLEDLHWADASSLDWLRDLQESPPAHRLLVVATTRPTTLDREADDEADRPARATITLGPLPPEDAARLIDEVLQRLPDPPGWLRTLLAEGAEGNPFFLEELVAWLVDRGTIRADAGGWSVTDAPANNAVPGTLRGLLEARLDGLDADERDLADRACVVGRVFWDRAVAHLAGRAEPDPEGTYRRLGVRDIVQRRPTSALSGAHEYAFRHALLRDVAYDGLLGPQRRRYHALTAAWLERAAQASGRADEHAAMVAQHLVAAGEGRRAAPWFLRAGRHAAASHAHDEALRLLEDARHHGADDPALVFDALAEAERVADRLGDREGQRAILAELLAAAGDDPARRSLALAARGRLEFFHAQYPQAAATGQEAADLARRAGRIDLELDALVLGGRSLAFHADHEAARDHLRALLARAHQAGSGRHVAEAQRLLGVVATNLHDEREAIRALQAAAEEFRAVADLDGEGMTTGQLGAVLLLTGRRDEAWVACEEALAIFVATGHRLRQGIVLGNMASIAHELGRLDEALRIGERTLALTRSVEDTEGITSSLQRLGDTRRLLRHTDAARRALDEAVRLGDAHDLHYFVGFAHASRALLELVEGDLDAALGHADAAAAAAARSQVPALEAFASFVGGVVAQARGDHATAVERLREASARHAELDMEAQAHECTACLAGALWDAGHTAEAVDAAVRVADALPGEEPGLVGWAEPGLTLPEAHRVLASAGRPEADAVARAARACLEHRAAAIADAAIRADFLATPPNRRLAGLGS